mmetsp:Transcript_31773/g.77432  ORF Transcript_31773/g.77432 Transcript_31773/m.77432 type:complete len:309 (-) Transcript_31773:329-1255(-)|eukprot:CAMPEP_0114519440 /NCGR_PEP_ID=MMETSP0109-20121206/19005_1 /TAXON_ID=29199 /ORGANISM="Chlorarachnion reptans, Strain CCCM449" /LENGTH=308 /DNA_ID=CAMNT_0001700181 /DNA_START=219 /DNA_END=1145 /DNA_ORIENTATION=-
MWTSTFRTFARGARPGLSRPTARRIPLQRAFSSTPSKGPGFQKMTFSAAVAGGAIIGLGIMTKDKDVSTTKSPMKATAVDTLLKALVTPKKAEAKEETAKKPDSSTSKPVANKSGPKKKMRSAYSVSIGENMPDEVQCFVEVAKGSRNKYEWDEKLGHIVLDRVLHSAVFYPHNYGFVPQTLCGDGDPLDVLIMGDNPLQPGCFVDVRPIGYLIMQDEKGKDEKLLAVPTKDPRLYDVKTLRDVPDHVLREVTQFFETYKMLEKDKWVKVGGWKGTEDAMILVKETHQTYKAEKAEKSKVFEYQEMTK